MTHIDPEKLEEAIEHYSRRLEEIREKTTAEVLDLSVALLEAARAHLATLPRFKEVEVEGWMVINSHGVPVCAHQHEMAARNYLEHGGVPGDRVVRLTGTAKVRA